MSINPVLYGSTLRKCFDKEELRSMKNKNNGREWKELLSPLTEFVFPLVAYKTVVVLELRWDSAGNIKITIFDPITMSQ